ncbi:MAG: hypothetical protein FJ020_09485 [Chloroflexi bacterium]|nr:hypothetical protein [Chloroflexota bacterium]
MAGRTVLMVDRVGGAEGASGIRSAGRAGTESRDLPLMMGMAAMVDRTCRRFAGDIDWQYAPVSWATSERWEGEPDLRCCMLTENDLALRAGGYVRVDTHPLTDQIKVSAGCYDPYFNPVVVSEKSMVLSELDCRTLRELLDEMHDKLTSYCVRRAT